MISHTDFSKMKVCSDILMDKTKCVYSDSVFLPLKSLSSRKKGKYFESIVKEWLTNLGMQVSKSKSSDHDCVVEGLKIEIKGSFLWEGTSGFKFQQIRTKQDYDIIFFVSVYPSHVEIHGCSKNIIKEQLEIKDTKGRYIYQQHGGKRGNGNLFWWSGYPNKTYWMKKITSKSSFSKLARGKNDRP
jgi:hypothetical protein